MNAAVYSNPTPSQYASAARHLENRDRWTRFRVDGIRYVALQSGTSSHVYQVRADAAGCSCPWYQKTLSQCSHMLALELAEMERELVEDAALGIRPLVRYEDVFGLVDAF